VDRGPSHPECPQVLRVAGGDDRDHLAAFVDRALVGAQPAPLDLGKRATRGVGGRRVAPHDLVLDVVRVVHDRQAERLGIRQHRQVVGIDHVGTSGTRRVGHAPSRLRAPVPRDGEGQVGGEAARETRALRVQARRQQVQRHRAACAPSARSPPGARAGVVDERVRVHLVPSREHCSVCQVLIAAAVEQVARSQ
jgi:hypothetical protein